MNRVNVLHLALMALWLVIGLGCQNQTPPPPPPQAEPEPEPAQAEIPVEDKGPANVILITADTMRGDVAKLDGGPVTMPHLEALAAEGWHFEESYSNSMLTTPSHISLMTSLST